MIRIGIVGLGGMGIVHINNYLHIEGCQVVAACDIACGSAEKAENFGIKHYTSIEEMIIHEQIDLVDICSPTFLHTQHVKEAISAGANVFVEKPIALKVEDATAMFKLAKEKGLRVFVGHVVRFTRESILLRQFIQGGQYGKVLDASFSRLSAAPRWIQNGWLFDKEKSGLIPFDLHIHDLDLMVSLFGKPKSYEFTSCGNSSKAYKEHYRFIYHYNEMNVCAQAAWYNADIPFTATWQVYFENAVVVNEGEGKVVVYQFDHEPHVFDTEEKVKIPTGINVPPTEIYLNELKHFIECMRENRNSELFDEQQILDVLEILEAINKE